MICVIATIETAPGRRDDLVRLFQTLAPKVRAEKGCIEYLPAVDAQTNLAPRRDNVVSVVEKWESISALELHLQAPHMVEFRKQAAPLRRGISRQVLDPAGS